jgi:poly[(R)-3-hydroxyalkanoate] polymerase subunit PhaC
MAKQIQRGNEQKSTKTRNMGEAVQHILDIQKLLIKNFNPKDPLLSTKDPFNLASAIMDFQKKVYQNPQKLMNAQQQLWENQMNLWYQASKKFMGTEDKSAQVSKSKIDRRFKDKAWDENHVFDLLKKSYLMTADWIHKTVQDVDGLDPGAQKKINFLTQQFVTALSPSNFAHTNPEVLRETIATGGENLVKGLENLKRDFERGKGKLHIKTVDHDFFKVGENIASTPGKIVYRNELIELIQYAPTTEQVYETPLLMIPPWINKYYIFDLSEKKSFVKWYLDQGYTVFVISWVNPDEKLAHKDFKDYMFEGVIDAVDAMTKTLGVEQVHVAGYCIGGTLLSMTLSYLIQKRKNKIKTASLLTCLLDFHNAGDVTFFIDDKQLDFLINRIDSQGYLDAKAINSTYSVLRSNDMIWSFVVNNYLLGRDAFPFDLLYWNDDSTHMPAAMMKSFLKNMYHDNCLMSRNGMEVDGVKLDMSKIDIPCFIMAAKEDHIAPWKNTYATTQLVSGPIKYVLSASGHVAGMANHPAQNKYCYWENDEEYPRDGEKWLAGTTEHKGSWWNCWVKWLNEHQDKKVAARDPSKGKLKPLDDAPGTYVRVQRI